MSLCFLLCAGQGTRLRPYTESRPKPRIPLLNLPLAHYGFYLAQKGGFNQFLLNKHHLPEQIDLLAKELSPFASEVSTVDETAKLLGSGGALWNARHLLEKQDYFLVANGDEVMIPKSDKVLSDLLEKFKSDSALCTLLTCDHPDLLSKLKAVWVNSDGCVQGFGMTAPRPQLNPVHYTGYKIFSRKIFDYLPEGESNIFYDVVVKAIVAGEKVTTHHLGLTPWFETGNFDSLLDASRHLALNHWEDLQKRRTFFNKTPFFKHFANDTLLVCEEEKDLNCFAQCEGTVILGRGVTFLQTFRLKNTIVYDDVQVEQTEDNKIIGR